MKRILNYFWPIIGLIAVVVSLWLLSKEFSGQSVGAEVWAAIKAVPPSHYALAGLSTLLAYAALAWYDRIALMHLNVHNISWAFVSLCSFTTYALSHNIGASVFSGAMVRYRAYTSKGMTPAQVAVLVALCSFTFAFGTVLLSGLVLVFFPENMVEVAQKLEHTEGLSGKIPSAFMEPTFARALGVAFLMAAALYVLGSILKFKPLQIGKFRLEYPRPDVVVWQIFVAPMELIGAAGIIYFALPAHNHIDFSMVLMVFLASFSLALLSHAPGGLGVLELAFVNGMPNVPKAEILAALLIFRLFYLVIPLLFALTVVVGFERGRFLQTYHDAPSPDPDPR